MSWINAKAIVALVLGIAIGAGAAWGFLATRGVQVEIVEGHTTNVNEAGTGIGLATEPGGRGKGYAIAGAFWREADGPWHTGGSTCLEPVTSGQRVRMGVVQVEPAMEAPGREIVVWLECLD
jgi:hypothetical protein